MSSPAITLPTETIYDIVLIVVIQYIDDLVLGPLSLCAKTEKGETKEVNSSLGSVDLDLELTSENPVLPFLVVSLQFRHVTLEVLSQNLGIPLQKEGIWRLEGKPWAKIYPVRKFWADSEDLDLSTLSETTVIDHYGDSDVLAVYVLLHVTRKVVETIQRGNRSFHLSDNRRQLPDINAFGTIVDKLHGHYMLCPRVFQLLMQPSLQGCTTRSLITQTYDGPLTMLTAQFFQYSMQLLLGTVSEAEATLSSMASLIRSVKRDDEAILARWKLTVPLSQAIGASRLTSWYKVLNGLSGHNSSGQTTEIAGEARQLRDVFLGRLKEMGISPALVALEVQDQLTQLSLEGL
ncbi:uncharacterized protein PHACADRAFT_186428 [Phanerochaete carnosa HHB-10118-sp]|uniref:Uncharacterized protein n=1 Tax=Phanerochaete carnosa (strain HHB-10118-sp) TaxID=650164 RepID=K5UQX9_PHACS|nr:uncharacterized protein PHACADRAFT_186428 [Phanerochaete carnosa HHB-10118-sp]EKM52246.1 hypothetical protein PHACADRAFT_186428 [Phanerochaete carnosa HHB-10118-sp]